MSTNLAESNPTARPWLATAAAAAAVGTVASLLALTSQLRWMVNPEALSSCKTGGAPAGTLSFFGAIAGIPGSVLTSLSLGLLLVLLLCAWRWPVWFARGGRHYLTAAATLAAAISMSLAYQLQIVWKVSCPTCMVTYGASFVVLLVCLLALPFSVAAFLRAALADLKLMAGRPALVLLGVMGAAVIVVTTASMARALSRAAVIGAGDLETEAIVGLDLTRASDREALALWHRSIKRAPLPPQEEAGRPGHRRAAVTVIKFNDYGCSYCQQTSLAYAPVLARLEGEFPGAVSFEQREFPGEAACNPALEGRGFPGRCEAALLSYAAEARGQRTTFRNWLYANASASPQRVQRAFMEIVGPLPDADWRLHFEERVQQDVTLAERLGIKATPAFWINGMLVNALPAPIFEALLRLELQRGAALSWRLEVP